jgi:catechol 2,3-dioxygenase-like lactoylglutathione lyase family enzyme
MQTTSRLLAAVPALPVSDERRAVSFFEVSLGFTELRHGEIGLGIVRRDAVEIHLWVPDGRSPGAEEHLAGSASCRIEVTGVEELYDACSRAGVVHPNAPLAATSWETREFGVLDPDHNLITFFERTPLHLRVTPGLGWPDPRPDPHSG